MKKNVRYFIWDDIPIGGTNLALYLIDEDERVYFLDYNVNDWSRSVYDIEEFLGEYNRLNSIKEVEEKEVEEFLFLFKL